MAVGVRVTRHVPLLSVKTHFLTRLEFYFIFWRIDMRGLRMDRAREYTGRPNVLGRNGAHLCEVPSHRTNRKSCSVGHVASTTSSLVLPSPFSPHLYISRMAHGHRRPSKGSLTGLARSHIQTSSLRLLYGCLGKHRGTWKSVALSQSQIRLAYLGVVKVMSK
jgi:hypothetical protein